MTATPPRPDVAERTCRGCGQVKTMRKGCRLCSDCKPGKAAGAKKGRRPAVVHDNSYERPGGLGFKVGLEVDGKSGQTDIRLEQWNATVGKGGDWVRIWLNQLEAAELRSWLVEQLGA